MKSGLTSDTHSKMAEQDLKKHDCSCSQPLIDIVKGAVLRIESHSSMNCDDLCNAIRELAAQELSIAGYRDMHDNELNDAVKRGWNAIKSL